ncbi:hypothetical protein BDV96DRAFT_313999 [Lophiotrema nucula]|uniref:Uncharacterized protein n=1 Tax=Lophiotrema nucula TaxID=690887 RepID=A0A6A5ZM60_9PLEO|nr:hypothetical protein BDV96DRAFT_313999 [Lophiotrema nucula]
MIVTSRPERDIQGSLVPLLGKDDVIRLQSSNVGNDIDDYIRGLKTHWTPLPSSDRWSRQCILISDITRIVLSRILRIPLKMLVNQTQGGAWSYPISR